MAKTPRTKEPTARYFGLDLSLSPGIAVIDVKKRIPTLIYADSIATTADDKDAERSAVVQAFIAQAIYAYKPFETVLREDFTSGRSKRATQTVFSAWSSADRALHTFGYVVDPVLDDKPLAPTSVKKLVTGNGKAEKKDVADAVVRILRLPDDYKWRTGYDDSDACAVILAYLIREELIDV